jgi:hypothetical protein
MRSTSVQNVIFFYKKKGLHGAPAPFEVFASTIGGIPCNSASQTRPYKYIYGITLQLSESHHKYKYKKTA